MKKKFSTTQVLVGTAVLAALVVVLQTVGSGIKIGPFSPTLSLVPIIIGAVIFGPNIGGVLGFVFSMVVLISVLAGTEVGGATMFSLNPVATVLIILIKGTLAGYLAGFVAAKLTNKNTTLGVAASAVAAPVCNTGIFCIGALIFFYDLIQGWGMQAGYDNAFAYILLALIGLNYLVELAIDIVLVPVIVRIINAVRRTV